ncbi:MAG: hypothetical protein LBN38_06450 [Verrucomicrobiota bacterium]|jgi:hypothetical protein|nr:hypothetical protein [Verrucomicrobiota bacterium]
MSKPYQIHVFGKPGCAKCHTLNDRLDAFLEEEAWQAFEKVYHDLETESGLVDFCEAECLNPQRVPGFYVSKADPETGRQEPLVNPDPGGGEPGIRNSALYSWIGLQTDYSGTGRGVITPKMIETVLRRAKAL